MSRETLFLDPPDSQDSPDRLARPAQQLIRRSVTLRRAPPAPPDLLDYKENWDKKVTKETLASSVTVLVQLDYLDLRVLKGSEDLLVQSVEKEKREILDFLDNLDDLDLRGRRD